MKVWVALYKGEGNWVNNIVRKWTKSIYSHAELVLDDKQTWIGISPFIKARLIQRKVHNYDPDKWDFYEIPVNQEQHNLILDFFNLTKEARYDWIGMLLSQCLPFRIKEKNKWYCSEWISYALRISNIIDWKVIKIFDQADLSPAKLHDILVLCNFEKVTLE